MVSIPEVCTNKITMITNSSLSSNNLVPENQSVNFQRQWMSNIRLLLVGYAYLIKSAGKPDQETCCGQILQSAVVIQKQTKISDKSLTIVRIHQE